MQPAPQHERPVGAVPQPAQQHGDEEIEIAPRPSDAIAAKRDIQIVAQEGRQRDVPAPPEFDDAGRLVRGMEVHRQANAHHHGRAQRHVRIGAEIKIDLECKEQRAQPAIGRSRCNAAPRRIEDGIGKGRQIVGDQRFLGEANGEKGHAGGQIVIAAAQLPELRDQVVVADDGAGDQMREIGDEQRVIQQAVIVCPAGIGIHQIADLLKREEADRQRQEEMRHRQSDAQHIIGSADEQSVVLEQRDQPQIESQPCDQQTAPVGQPRRARLDFASQQKVHAGRAGQQDQEVGPPPGIEGVRRQQQEHAPRREAAAFQPAEPDHRDAQEDEIRIGIEGHIGPAAWRFYRGYGP